MPAQPAPDVPKGRGRGRGRGGRGKGGRSGGHEVQDSASADTDTKKQNNQRKGSFLLANLVRAGNQMQSGSSWSIVRRSVLQIISKNLILLPLSQLPPRRVMEERAARHREILTLLGKLPNPDQCGRVGRKPPDVFASAEELLQCLAQESFLIFPVTLDFCRSIRCLTGFEFEALKCKRYQV